MLFFAHTDYFSEKEMMIIDSLVLVVVLFPVLYFSIFRPMRQHISKRAEIEKLLKKTNAAYERFVPHEFIDILPQDSILDIGIGSQVRKEMTILFSDIRNFTALSENITPQENFNFINAYLKWIGPVVRNHQGFIDKYIE